MIEIENKQSFYEVVQKLMHMWPYIIGAGAVVYLLKELIPDEKKTNEKVNKRVFVSFAKEDEQYRDYLVEQAKNERSPFTFVDMSVKKPWDEKEWKQKCRTKIKSCDGVIVLLSKRTWHSSGSRWEIKCAVEEGITTIGMHIKKNDKGAIPPELKGKSVITWSWKNLSKAIKNDIK